jgi:hypothetical protein
MIPHSPDIGRHAEPPRSRTAIALAAVVVAFCAHAMLFAIYLVPWDAEWGYVTLGRLAVEGRISLFQDEMNGERMPLPYYVIGLSQLAGPSLLAARAASLAIGALAVILTFRAGAAIAGPSCGLLAAAFLATHGVVVGYFGAASYFSVCSALTAGGIVALTHLRRPWGSVLCMACFVGVAFARANLAVMAPLVFGYLIWTAATRAERLMLLAVFAGPPALFFASSSDHWKILAYVPILERLVAPLGYRSGFALGAHELFPSGSIARAALWFGRMHFFWLATGAVFVMAWTIALTRGVRPLSRGGRYAALCAVLVTWTLAWQIVILREYPKSVAAWVASFAPPWAVLLGWAGASLLASTRLPAALRLAVVAAIAVAFAIGPSHPRHGAMPLPLPTPSTIRQLEAVAETIRRVVPPGERVFVFGSSLPAYLAGGSPYLRQTVHPGAFSASSDAYAVSRSGMWGASELEAWLGRETRYALIDTQTVDRLGEIEAYRPLLRRMFALLDRHFELVAAVVSRPGDSQLRIFRRRGLERS